MIGDPFLIGGQTMANPTVKHWQDPVNLMLGLWLIASPWILRYQSETYALWSAVGLGVLVAASAIAALFRVKAWEEWANVVLGLAAIASPWILRFSESVVATSNTVIIGIVVAALALWALATDKDIGGWWSPAT
jgi:SPW repeat